ncbi:MAG: CYTH domain-containing protein [Candidatus Komeilibacteria bacterium]
MLYEVEVSSLLKPAGFKKVYKYLKRSGKLLKEEQTETVVFETSKGDLRLVKNEEQVKLICKIGNVFHEVRPEMEVLADIKDMDELEKIFIALGFKVACRYKKKRVHFRWQGTTISLDNVKGFGLIMEMEKLVDGRLVKKAEEDIREKLTKLLDKFSIAVTPVSELNKMYKHYLNNWSKLIKKNYTRI